MGGGLSTFYWALPLLEIHVKSPGNDTIFTVGKELSCGNGTRCFIDSGTPYIGFPSCVAQAGEVALAADSDATLEVVLSGVGEQQRALLAFPLKLLAEMLSQGFAKSSGGCGADTTGETLMLGFPTWLFYYTVFDYGTTPTNGTPGAQVDTKVTFVKKA